MLLHVPRMLPLLAASILAGWSQAAGQEQFDPADWTAQIIIKFDESPISVSDRLDELERLSGRRLVYVRPMSLGAHVVRPQDSLNREELNQLMDRLQEAPSVEYAELDRVMRPNLIGQEAPSSERSFARHSSRSFPIGLVGPAAVVPRISLNFFKI